MDFKIAFMLLLVGAIIILVQYSDALATKQRNRKQNPPWEE